MIRIKQRRFFGAVCEQVVYTLPDRIKNILKAKPKPRFKDDAEREAHRLAISRRKFIRVVNCFGPTALYVTLTLDNEDEVHTFPEARRIRDNYIRRLLYHVPEAKIVMVMGRGKHTDRIHYHMIAQGIGQDLLVKLWGMGDVVRVQPLRGHNYYNGVDHGRDYTGLANYLFDHWTPEQGGRRWKQTRNLRPPEPEKPVQVRREYTVKRPPRPPKGYMLVDTQVTQYGYLYFKYVLIPSRHRK